MRRTYVGLILVGLVIFGGVLAYGYVEKRGRSREFRRAAFITNFVNEREGREVEELRAAAVRPNLSHYEREGRWVERLDELSRETRALRDLFAKGERIQHMIEGNVLPSEEMYAQSDELHDITRDLGERSRQFRTRLAALGQEIKATTFYLEDRPRMLAEAQKARVAVDALFSPELDRSVARAVAAYPVHKPQLEEELAKLKKWRTSLHDFAGKVEAIDRQNPRTFAVSEFRNQHGTVVALHKNTTEAVAKLVENARDVDFAVSHVLMDARMQGILPQQLVRIVRVAKDGAHTVREEWRAVSEQHFDADLDSLGMTLLHKPRGELYGRFRPTGPAGFEYVGDEALGDWTEDGGGDATWRFKRAAVGLGGLVVGGAVLRSVWKKYRAAMDAGRYYYGEGRWAVGTKALRNTPAFRGRHIAAAYALYEAQKNRRSAERARSYRQSSSSYRGSSYRGSSYRSYGK